MPNTELFNKLLTAELKGKSNFYLKFTGRPGLDEIRNHRSSQLPSQPAGNKVFRHTWLSRLSTAFFLLPIISIPFKPEAWLFDCFASFVILLLMGIQKSLTTTFGNYRIEITSQGMRVERDRYAWSQIEGAFILLRPGKGQYYKLVLAVNGGQFKTYDLGYYRRLDAGISEALKYYIAPHLPVV